MEWWKLYLPGVNVLSYKTNFDGQFVVKFLKANFHKIGIIKNQIKKTTRDNA